MPAKHFYSWLTGVLLALLTGVWLRGSALGSLLILGSVASAGWACAALLHPWLGTREYYRVRYHAQDESCLSAVAIGRGLYALAQQGDAVALVWRREAGELMLYIEIPVEMAEACEGMLSRLLPEATLEAVPPPPPPLSAEGFSRWSSSEVQAGEIANPFDFTQLLSEQVLIGDFELRAHLAPRGAAVVLHGTSGQQATAAGLRPLWKVLWRSTVALVPQMLFRRYPLLGTWPRDASGAIVAPSMHFPMSVGEGTSRLDVQASTVIALPDDYCFPEEEEALLLGAATAGNRPVGLPLREWGQHFLVLGGGYAERQAIVAHGTPDHRAWWQRGRVRPCRR